MSHANATLDFESANLPAAGLPASDIHPASFKREKDMVAGHALGDEVVVSAAADLDSSTPTDEEYATLRKVPGTIKWTVVAMCAIELAERASYYGTSGPFNNFINNPLPKGGNGLGAVAPGAAGSNQSAGALNLGSVAASAVTNTFTFLAYVVPIAGAIVADTKWGRFKTICVGTAIGFIAHVLLVIPGLPGVIDHKAAFAPFMIGVIILAGAAGFIKPSLGPLLCDQSPVKRPTVVTDKKGERVILDPQTTVQRYLLIFYWCINVGAFFSVATSYSERLVGFWLAFLEPGLVYLLMPIVLFLCYKHLYLAPPQGSVVYETILVFKELFRRGGLRAMFRGGDTFWDQAKPSYMEAAEGSIDRNKIFWDDQFVDEIRQSLSACAVFFLIPIYNLADGGIGNQLNDMSVAMTLNGIPNDVINNFNPLTIIIATPIITWGLYPLCDKIGFPLRPMTRMCIGFLLGTANMIIAAIVQARIYRTSPCGHYATNCELGVSPVNISWLIPMYAIPAVGEIFVNVTSYELAYTRAPARMKGLVYALCLFSTAISSAIGLACSNAIQDPYLVWPYVALAAATFVVGLSFPIFFRHLNVNSRVFADADRQAGLQQPNAKGEAYAHEQDAYTEK